MIDIGRVDALIIACNRTKLNFSRIMTGMYALLTSALGAARRLSISLGRYATVFQAEIYATLASAHEIQLHGRPEKL